MTLLKLPPQDPHWQSLAAILNGVEADIASWAISKPILAARRLRKDGSRGIRLGDITDMHNHLVSGARRTLPNEVSREARILARVTHTLGSDHGHWAEILSTD